jgi:hypothetical protein
MEVKIDGERGMIPKGRCKTLFMFFCCLPKTFQGTKIDSVLNDSEKKKKETSVTFFVEQLTHFII